MTDIVYLGILLLLLIIVGVGDFHLVKYMNKSIQYIKKPYYFIKKKITKKTKL